MPDSVHHSRIVIPPDRQRQVFDTTALSDLATSIAENGLLQPVVLRDGSILVAGERRVRAIQLLELQGKSIRHGRETHPPGHVPYLDFGALDPIAAETAELEENLRRINLSWQEEERAIARLHALRKAASPEQSRRDTGRELFPDLHSDAAQSKVAVSERLTAAMTRDPTIAKAKSRAEALKLLRKSDDIELRTRLSADAAAVTVSSRHTVVLADCVGWLVAQPPATFDAIIIDPPYGMGADEFGDAAGRLAGTEHLYADDAAGTQRLLRRVIPELFRVGKAAHHLYIWCDIDMFHWLRAECTDAGYWTHRTPLVNVKREGGRVPWPEHGPRRCYELCLYAVAGKKPTTAIYPDVFDSTLSEGNFGHGAQKPVEAYVNLLRRSCRPGDSVLDCFAGSGPLLDAAEVLALRSTLVEQAPHAHGIILERLARWENAA